MGLRDFLTGAQQFQQGSQDFSKTAQEMRQQDAQQQLSQGLPDLLSKLRTGTPEQQAQLAGQFQGQYLQAGGSLKDTADQIAKFALPEQAKGKNEAYKIDEIKAIFPDKSEQEQYKIANMSRSAQDALLGQSKQAAAEEAKSARQKEAQGTQINEKNKTAEADFGKLYASSKKKFDESIGGIKAQYDTFLSNPTKQSAVNVALAVGKSAGLVGSTSENEVERQTFTDAAQKFQQALNFVQNEPEGTLRPEIIAAYKNLMDNTIKSAADKRKDVLMGQIQTLVPAYSSRLFEGNKKSQVLKSIEKEQGIDISKDENGDIVITKSKTEHTGLKSELIQSANSIKDPIVRNKFKSVLNSYKGDIPEDKYNALKAKIDQLSGGVEK